MSVREVWLASARGEKLHGQLHEPDGPSRGSVALSPCFTCTKDIAPIRNLARDLAASGFTALRYDPVGSGKSEGRFEEATVSRYRDDLVAIARPLERPLLLVGHSLGGAVSILAAEQIRPDKLVTLATNARKDSLRRLLGEEAFERAKREGSVPFDPGDGVLRPLTRAFVEDLERHEVLAAGARLPCPLLVLHGDGDSLVPLAAALELARAARARLVVLPGSQHLCSRKEDRERIRSAVLAFLEGRE